MLKKKTPYKFIYKIYRNNLCNVKYISQKLMSVKKISPCPHASILLIIPILNE
jgi:hypothetical protein